MGMMKLDRVLLLGCGFTGKRVARQLLKQGVRVTATTREPAQLEDLRQAGATIQRLSIDREVEPEALREFVGGDGSAWDAMVYSIPTLRNGDGAWEPATALLPMLSAYGQRLIYLSTTGVYGAQERVDARTRPAPRTERELLRTEAEASVLAHFAQALVLRPAAIYGPGRGVHVSMRQGKYRLSGDGGNYISRIHVDDLAFHVVAGLWQGLTGAWPVADEEPCTQREMAAFCAELLGVPLPEPQALERAPETLTANRQVDGSEVRKALGLTLRYPSYRQGVPAALAEEAKAAENN